jgi:hypothetical protein
LRRRGMRPDTVGEVTQETFLIAAERLSDIHPRAERAFLISTALRAAGYWGPGIGHGRRRNLSYRPRPEMRCGDAKRALHYPTCSD